MTILPGEKSWKIIVSRMSMLAICSVSTLVMSFLISMEKMPASTKNPAISHKTDHRKITQNHLTKILLPSLMDERVYIPLISSNSDDLQATQIDQWYLMVDDGHIDYRDVERVYHPFRKHPNNPIIRADKPWEGSIIQLYGTVLPGFRMWYSSVNVDWGIRQILYAESEDGIQWNKPDIDGAGKNIVSGGEDGSLVSVINTPKDDEAPHKLMVNYEKDFHGYWSADGIQLYPYLENPVFSNGHDVAQFYWDSHKGRYNGTVKEVIPVRGVPRRVIRFIGSNDFINWSWEPEIFEPDVIDDEMFPGFYPQFYGFPTFPMGEQYLGLLWVLNAPDWDGLYGQVHIQLASSHDGIHWIREEGDRPAILDLGGPSSWEDGQIYTATRPIVVGDEFWLYYNGCNQEHGAPLEKTACHIGLATAPYNRLASLSGTGILITDMLSATGSSLHINYDGSQGMIRLELLRDGLPIPGYEADNCISMSKDSLDQIVMWTDQDRLPEGDFQIKFYLDNSALYAFIMK